MCSLERVPLAGCWQQFCIQRRISPEYFTMSAPSTDALALPSANFESRKFRQINEHTLRIQPSIGSLAFSLLFVLIGVGLIVFWMSSTFSSFDSNGSVFVLLGGILFAGIGMAFYRISNQQVVVHRETGVAFIRSWWPSAPLNTQSMFRHIEPQELASVQLVSRVVTRTSRNRSRSGHQRGRQSTRSYTEFQVNLCTSDNERHNAFITLKSDKAKAVGKLIAQILDVPLVDHV